MDFIILLIVWLPLCGLVGWIASQKGRSGAGLFFLSLFLTPLLGLLVVIALPSRSEPATAAPGPKDLVRCHSCNGFRMAGSGSWLPACPHCGAGARDPKDGLKKCPACAEMVKEEATKCRFCGEVFPVVVMPTPRTPFAVSTSKKVD